MATIPAGLLSFLYHVTYDAEFNKRFAAEETEEDVMMFFQVPFRVKEQIRRISPRERNDKRVLIELQNRVKQAGAAVTEQERRALEQAEDAYAKRTVLDPEAMAVVLAALGEELNEGIYRRFW
jgi:hypothetical protein